MVGMIIVLLQNAISKLSNGNKNIDKYVITTLKQYTFWNLLLILINVLFYRDLYFEIFIFINTTVIFITYYILHMAHRDKVKTFPNIPPFFNEADIEISMFLVHALPFVYYFFKMMENYEKIKIFYNIGFETALFNVMWVMLNFFSFDPSSVYFSIEDEHLYFIWVLMIFLHFAIGYLFIHS